VRYFVTLHGESIEVELGPTKDGRTAAKIHRRAAGVVKSGAKDGAKGDASGAAGGADGATTDHALELRPIDGLSHCAVVVDGSCRDVLLAEDARGMHVTVDGVRHEVAIEDERERAAHLAAAAAPKGPITMRAVMPGILRAVLVKPGDTVKAGQPLVILEAMKMENELRAEHPGIVREVKVAAGSPVEGGAALIVIEPPKS
jgi:biotin carboxyl carrier protein